MKSKVILPISAALAALPLVADQANAAPTDQTENRKSLADPSGERANVTFPLGKELLGLIVTKRGDGTVVAQHASHVSHHSHHSHHSHYSSR